MGQKYCGRCGVQIPKDEVASGASLGPLGTHHCSQHRVLVGTAVAERSLGGPEAAEDDAQLLFCSNCLVSIPQHDVRSGRARSEYGSMLCAPCSKADPGERAARREAVEAEMQADLVGLWAAMDPVISLVGPAFAGPLLNFRLFPAFIRQPPPPGRWR